MQVANKVAQAMYQPLKQQPVTCNQYILAFNLKCNASLLDLVSSVFDARRTDLVLRISADMLNVYELTYIITPY